MPLVRVFARGDQPLAGKRRAVVRLDRSLVKKRRPIISFFFLQQAVIDLRFLRRRVDFLTRGEADLFIDFVQGQTDGVSFGLLQVDIDVVLVDKFLGNSLGGT